MMNKSAIDWCDFSWNPVTGCNFGCEYCYARRQATRFAGNTRLNMTNEQLKTDTAGLYILEQPFKNYNGAVLPFPAGFAPTFHKYRLGDPAKKKKPANIFVCSMADLFGNWIPEEWIEAVFEACKAAPQHNYLFLTKNPGRYQTLAAAGKLPELPNFWYGSSITGPENSFWWSEYHHTFVSYEPMLKPLGIADGDAAAKVDWIIAGAETGHRAGKITPEEGWLEELAAAARRAGVPLWIKDSEEIRAVIGGEPAQALPDALKCPKDRPTPHCAECEHCVKTQEGQSEAHGKNAPLDGQPRATRMEAPATFRPEETASHPTGAREERTMQNEQPREHGRPGLPYCQHGPDPYAGRNPYRRSSRRERSGRTH